MIDIHSHILPGVDDGAKTEEESISMAIAAVNEGISTIVATPHHRNLMFDNYKKEIETSVAILNDLLQEKDIPLSVVPGQEIRIYGEIVADFHHGDIQTIHNSKYVLIEFHDQDIPQYTEKLFYEMQTTGLIPIIAHPERNQVFLEKPDRLYDLVRVGALTQLTAGSLLGKFGKEIEQFSHQLIEANLVHFIASDAHNTSSRGFYLREAYERIKEMYGIETYYMLLENSQLLIDDDNVNRFEPYRVKPKRKNFFSLFRK